MSPARATTPTDEGVSRYRAMVSDDREQEHDHQLDDDIAALLARRRGMQSFIKPDALEAQKRVSVQSPYLDAAENLLFKARRALFEEDPERAARYVERAVQLPFDDHEEVQPAGHAAHMMLFNLISDELEEADEDDDDWLQAAARVFETADLTLRAELRDVLEDVAGANDLTKSERRYLSKLLADAPPRQAVWDSPLPADELRDQVLTILRACEAYQDVLDELI